MKSSGHKEGCHLTACKNYTKDHEMFCACNCGRIEHEMNNWSCKWCGLIEEDTGFKEGCKAKLCYYCGFPALHDEGTCPDRIQI